MAKKGRRKFRRYIRGQIDFEISLLTLGGNTAISGTESQVLTEQAWLSSVKCSWALRDMTAAPADGPIWAGVSHSDYTTAEIEEWIENAVSWAEGDQIGREVARRKIRQVGIFRVDPSQTGIGAVVLNLGRPTTTKCGWQLSTGQTVRFWYYNQSSGALTTGAVALVNGHANLWPN